MSLADLCEKPIEVLPAVESLENPYERILAREVLNWFNHSRFVAFFHSNPISADDRFKVNIMLKKQYSFKTIWKEDSKNGFRRNKV